MSTILTAKKFKPTAKLPSFALSAPADLLMSDVLGRPSSRKTPLIDARIEACERYASLNG